MKIKIKIKIKIHSHGKHRRALLLNDCTMISKLSRFDFEYFF